MAIWPDIHVGPIKLPKVPVSVELWAGNNIEVPQGSYLWRIAGWPEDWKVRLSLELTLFKFLFFPKNISLNLVLTKKVDIVSAVYLTTDIYQV